MSQFRRCIVAVLIIILLTRVYYRTTLFRKGGTFSTVNLLSTLPDPQPVKKILFWYEQYKPPKRRNSFEIAQGPTDIAEDAYRLIHCQLQCDVFNRGRIVNWELLEEYDAIIFHQHGWTPYDVPVKRWPHQHYVFLSMESPAWRFVDTESMKNFFNRTMTYRRDSDIYNPYGWFSDLTESVTLDSSRIDPVTLRQLKRDALFDSTNYGAGKTKKVAWFVSNCKSLSARNEYADRLKTFIDVDIYGQCGTMRCSRSNPELCHEMLERDYKFYLSFENTLCEDYVTEKYFDQMRYHIVPIVFDLHGHHKRIAPPHSYINAADYQSVRELADYLLLLDRNDKLYNEYFWWKNHYVVGGGPGDTTGGMCRLCDYLHKSTLPLKVYQNMTQWWDVQSKCRTVGFMNNTLMTKNNSDFYWESFLA
ncbi:alpha-(1,3)-fucosyltransferase C-like [Daphnia carinata]|uniref:alpha-(1,3)-fucosyltransferase C-like n=1 Tax=Daphnia carinata TaxID=120202 RepID=UPI00257C857C|nr:alpha-(1,3)-fucosyltransferase C-like [Daphnia carinata]XP_057381101.1 alpha-(1,3)-fucosyltransferase C-like [Daphnia carinata]XP_059352342.1 alpha-(1,3)-fucosyltransferase C-like [Daphnia carinata]